MKFACPNCGSTSFYAVEQVNYWRTCEIERSETGPEIVFDARGEFVKDAASAVVLVYLCASECGFTMLPADLSNI